MIENIEKKVVIIARIIVSFTSYPARIKTVVQVLASIAEQTILPDKIILYLSSDQFSGYGELPDFGVYKKYGFEICWNKEDLGPHKKYYYAMQQYPNDIIITIDDDIYYKNTMIEELMTYHKKYPRAVITRRAHLVTWLQDGNIAPYEKWYIESLRYVGEPRMDLVSTGVSGVLYPPHVFQSEIFNKKIFMEKSPYADDLWLKVMELYSEVPVVLTQQFFDDPGLEDYRKNGLCCNQNANDGNDIQLEALLKSYGDVFGKENFLIKRLGVDGKLMLSDYKEAKKNDILKVLNEYFKFVDDQEKIFVYGAGNVARKIYDVFEKTGRLKKINAFIVNCTRENKQEVGGIRVADYMDFMDSSEKIIIGLGESKQDGVYKVLAGKGIDEDRIIKLHPLINKLISII